MQSDRDESHTARRSICVADGAACGRCGPCWRRRGLVSALADGVLLRVVEYSQQQPLPHARGVVSFQIWSVPCRSTSIQLSLRVGELTTMIQEGTEFFILDVLKGSAVGCPHEVLTPAVQMTKRKICRISGFVQASELASACHLNAEYKR